MIIIKPIKHTGFYENITHHLKLTSIRINLACIKYTHSEPLIHWQQLKALFGLDVKKCVTNRVQFCFFL